MGARAISSFYGSDLVRSPVDVLFLMAPENLAGCREFQR